jgi:hypothetical protein
VNETSVVGSSDPVDILTVQKGCEEWGIALGPACPCKVASSTGYEELITAHGPANPTEVAGSSTKRGLDNAGSDPYSLESERADPELRSLRDQGKANRLAEERTLLNKL